ncbi:MAG: prepilin peptidase [Patescibacteria group bacterium]|nr:prepilin peptidase [Patescibacteria group bacterium]
MQVVIFLFFLGLIIGSFLNVLIYRLNTPKAPKWWQGRSFCPRCRHQLSWTDNVPLLSFLLLKGNCRYCHKKISWQYPVVELVTAASFAVIGFQPALLGLAAVFIVIFFSDLIYGLIPMEMIVMGSFLALILNLVPNLLTGILSGLIFWFIVRITRGKGMGEGDIYLAFLIGWVMGWPQTLIAFWIAFVLGGAWALALLVLKKVRFSDTIALGPFLVAGVVLAALCAPLLLSKPWWP